MNKLLMEENDRLQKQVSNLVYENGYFRQQTQNVNKKKFDLFLFCFCFTDFPADLTVVDLTQTALATTDTSCESVVTSGQHHLTPQNPPRDASPAGLVTSTLVHDA